MTPPAEQLLLPGLRPFTRSYRPRPTRDSVVEAAAAALLDRIAAEWQAPDPAYRGEWEESLVRVLRDARPGADGWALCRDLEGDGWDVDSELVSIMDGAGWAVDDALRAAEVAWVADTHLLLALEVGEDVTVDLRGRGAVAGRVVDRDPRRGTYTVRVPSLGHTAGGLGVRGVVVPAESVPGGVAYEPLEPVQSRPAAG